MHNLTFSPIEFSHRSILSHFTKQFEPYSDFNFTSLYAYNTHDLAQYSILNNNLVLLFEDYLTSEKFLSVLGTSSLLDTFNAMTSYCKSNNISREFRLIPEVVLRGLGDEVVNKYRIEEDVDNHDYILDVKRTMILNGQKMRGKKNQRNRFQRLYPDVEVSLDSERVLNLQDIDPICKSWIAQTNQPEPDVANEYSAIQRVVKISRELDVQAIGLYEGAKMIGFCIYEMCTDSEYTMLHFIKADKDYDGIYTFLQSRVAAEVDRHRYKYINLEQDLGIPGLRKNKLTWQPCKYLRKFKVEAR